MFFCNNCGAKIDSDNAKFCPKCGNRFENKNKTAAKSDSSASMAGSGQVADNNAVPLKNISKIETVSDVPSEKTVNAAGAANVRLKAEAGNGNGNVNSNNPAINKKRGNSDKEKKRGTGKLLLIVLIIVIIVLAGTAGAIFYLNKTGKINVKKIIKKIKKDIFSDLHINKSKNNNESSSEFSSSGSSNSSSVSVTGKSSKSKTTKGNKTKQSQSGSTAVAGGGSSVGGESSAPTYVYHKKSSNSYGGNAFYVFKNSLDSARAYVTGVNPLSNSGGGNAPAVIISNAEVSGASAYQGNSLTLHSKFYAETPPNFSSQNVKLYYTISGNGLTAYNISYAQVNKPGIYSVALTVNVPSNFPTGTYNYTLTVTSPATIEESPVAVIKIK
jgi:predicted  nucleic acid-binding Zn-ribbon protein